MHFIKFVGYGKHAGEQYPLLDTCTPKQEGSPIVAAYGALPMLSQTLRK